MQTSSKAKGYFALLVTSIVWGTTWVVSKIGVNLIPALQMAAIRQFIGGLIFIAFFLFYKKASLPTGKQFLWLFIMAIIMFVSANGLSTWSIQFIPAGLSALIGALYPLSVVIIEKVFFKSRKLTALTFTGLILGIAGIAVVFYENAFHKAGPHFLFGVFLSAIAMLSWSVGTVFIARNKTEIDPYYGIGWQMMLASIMLFIITEISGKKIPYTEIPLTVWLCIGYLVLFGSLAAFIAFIYSMKRLSPALASLYAYINPLIAMITAHFVLDERLTMNILWGALLTLAGVYLVNYSMKNISKLTEPEI